MIFPEVSWVFGAVGGALFLFTSWAVSNTLNWRANMQVRKEVEKLNITTIKILEVLENGSRKK